MSSAVLHTLMMTGLLCFTDKNNFLQAGFALVVIRAALSVQQQDENFAGH